MLNELLRLLAATPYRFFRSESAVVISWGNSSIAAFENEGALSVEVKSTMPDFKQETIDGLTVAEVLTMAQDMNLEEGDYQASLPEPIEPVAV